MTKILEDIQSSLAYAELSAARVEPDAEVTTGFANPAANAR